MKQQLKPLAIGLILAGLVSMPAFAATSNAQDMKKLQQQVNQLAREVNTLKAQKSNGNRNTTPVSARQNSAQTIAHVSNNLTGPNNLPQSGISYLPVDLDVPGQSFVSTGPYLGQQISFSGSNLIINTPSINEDVALMKLRKNVTERLIQLGVPHEDHSHLLLSGVVEGQAFYNNRGGQSNVSDIDVTNAQLDAYILGPSPWVQGMMEFSYENDSGSSSGSITTNHRTSNSRVFINKAFITVGNFSESPFYGTIGQFYVPFGTYSSSMISNPLTKSLFRTKARAILLGFQQQSPNALYASLYTFRGDSRVVNTSSQINNGGVNFGYKFKNDSFNGDIGAGVIGNVADSGGMQKTDNRSLFDGFGSTSTSCGPLGTSACGNEQLVHRVPGYDVHGSLSIGQHWDLLAEYVTASTPFNAADMTYNGKGAKPQALNAEAAYSFEAFNKPTSVAVGYGMTRDALAIGLPRTRYAAVLNTSWWKNTLQSLEFRHDINYANNSTSTGSGVAGPTGTGKSNNVVTAQFDIYF